MTAVAADITLDAENGASVVFTRDGRPYEFHSLAARDRAVIKALESAKAEARRQGDDLREHDIALVQKARADRLEAAIAKLRG